MARGSAALPALALLALAVGCGPGADGDHDGWIEPGDCDDRDPETHPEAFEVPYDDVDQDCDGFDIVDEDEDGFDSVQAGGDDCNDYRPDVHPDAHDTPYDGTDADCDGASDYDVDGDGDLARGYGGEDCDDDDPTIEGRHDGQQDLPRRRSLTESGGRWLPRRWRRRAAAGRLRIGGEQWFR